MGLHSISKISKKLKISYSRIYRILEANGNPVKKEDKSLCRNKDFQIKITSEQLNIITLTLAEELKLAVETYERFISNNDLIYLGQKVTQSFSDESNPYTRRKITLDDCIAVVTANTTTTIKKRLVNIIRRKGQEGKVSSIQGYRLLHSIITSHLFHIFTDEEDSKRIDSYFGFSTDIHSGREAFKKLFYNLKALMSNENTRKISFN